MTEGPRKFLSLHGLRFPFGRANEKHISSSNKDTSRMVLPQKRHESESRAARRRLWEETIDLLSNVTTKSPQSRADWMLKLALPKTLDQSALLQRCQKDVQMKTLVLVALGCAHIRQVAENQALSGLTRTMTKDLATSQENLSWAELAARYLEQSKSDLSARNRKLLDEAAQYCAERDAARAELDMTNADLAQSRSAEEAAQLQMAAKDTKHSADLDAVTAKLAERTAELAGSRSAHEAAQQQLLGMAAKHAAELASVSAKLEATEDEMVPSYSALEAAQLQMAAKDTEHSADQAAVTAKLAEKTAELAESRSAHVAAQQQLLSQNTQDQTAQRCAERDAAQHALAVTTGELVKSRSAEESALQQLAAKNVQHAAVLVTLSAKLNATTIDLSGTQAAEEAAQQLLAMKESELRALQHDLTHALAATCLQSRAFAQDAWQQLTAREEQHIVELAAVRAQVAAVNAQVAAAHAQLDFTEDELERSHAEEEAARQKLASVEKRLQNLSESTLQTISVKNDEIQEHVDTIAQLRTSEQRLKKLLGKQQDDLMKLETKLEQTCEEVGRIRDQQDACAYKLIQEQSSIQNLHQSIQSLKALNLHLMKGLPITIRAALDAGPTSGTPCSPSTPLQDESPRLPASPLTPLAADSASSPMGKPSQREAEASLQHTPQPQVALLCPADSAKVVSGPEPVHAAAVGQTAQAAQHEAALQPPLQLSSEPKRPTQAALPIPPLPGNSPAAVPAPSRAGPPPPPPPPPMRSRPGQAGKTVPSPPPPPKSKLGSSGTKGALSGQVSAMQASGSSGKGSSSKQQPVAKTKALFWEKLDPKKVDISRTVWHTMPKRDVPEETVAALELFFPASLSSAKGPVISCKAKQGCTGKILDQARARRLEIILAHFRKDALITKGPEHLVHAMCSHGTTLTSEHLNLIEQLLPIDGDHKMLKIYIIDKFGRPEDLLLTEQYIYALDNVARPQQKLAALLFLDSFQKSIADLRTAAHCIETASCQILTSTRWSIVCREVLAIGNIMNSGTARGSAHGVRLASLLKLADIKIARGKAVKGYPGVETWLDFIASQTMQAMPASEISRRWFKTPCKGGFLADSMPLLSGAVRHLEGGVVGAAQTLDRKLQAAHTEMEACKQVPNKVRQGRLCELQLSFPAPGEEKGAASKQPASVPGAAADSSSASSSADCATSAAHSRAQPASEPGATADSKEINTQESSTAAPPLKASPPPPKPKARPPAAPPAPQKPPAKTTPLREKAPAKGVPAPPPSPVPLLKRTGAGKPKPMPNAASRPSNEIAARAQKYAPKQAKAPGAVTVKLIAPHGPDEDRAFASLLSAALDPVSAPLAEALANEQRMQAHLKEVRLYLGEPDDSKDGIADLFKDLSMFVAAFDRAVVKIAAAKHEAEQKATEAAAKASSPAKDQ